MAEVEDFPVDMWYVSGPMRGVPDDNRARFDLVTDYLEALGNVAWSPHKAFPEDENPSLAECFAEDFVGLCDSSHIVFLPGWQNSAGCRIEYLTAKELGLSMHLAMLMQPPNSDEYVMDIVGMLDSNVPPELAAGTIVRNGAREATYGPPMQDFTRTAHQWHGLGIAPGAGPEDVALAMTSLKLSRLRGTRGHYDSIVDAIGYLVCYSRIVGEA